MKRKPNNYGTIYKLNGNRLKKWVAYSPNKNVNGKRKREVIGYFETREEAEFALAVWNRNRGTKTNYSLKELYEEWIETAAFKKISKSTADGYRAAWKHLEPIHNYKVREIRAGHFQEIIDNLTGTMSYSSLHKIKVLSGLLEKYALQYDIIEKNYAEFISLPENETKEKEIFTDEQLETIKRAAEAGDETAMMIVILCYSGWRISEFLGLEPKDYDPINKTFTGGLKTENGKNRIVPVHPYIQSYIDYFLSQNGKKLITRPVQKGQKPNYYIEREPITSNYFRKFMFADKLTELGIKRSDGEDFTPHVTRHTFATICRKNNVDPLVTKKLLGHSPSSDVTEKVYTHVDLDMLNSAISKVKAERK